MAPAALSLFTVTFTEPRARARAFGVFGALSGGGAAIGLIVGGVLTEYTSWRWCLGVNLPVALLVAAAAIPLVRESKTAGNSRYDVPGLLLATGGLFALVYGFTEAAKQNNPGNPQDTSVQGWGDPSTLTFLVAALALLVAFVIWERRAQHPMLPMRIVLDRNRGGSYLIILLVSAGLFAMFLFLSYYFQLNLGYTPLQSGFAFLPFSLGIILTAGAASQLPPRTGPRPLLIAGLVMAVAGMLWLTQIGQDTSFLTDVLPAELVLSIGLGLVLVPASSTALVGVDSNDAGVASAVLNTAQQIGGSLGTALLNTMYAAAVTGYLTANLTSPDDAARLAPIAFLAAYHTAFVWGAALLAVGVLVAVFVINARRDDVPSHDPELSAQADG